MWILEFMFVLFIQLKCYFDFVNYIKIYVIIYFPDIDVDTVNKSFFDKKSLFIHNRDKDGCKMLIFTVSKHVKGSVDMDELRRFFIYWVERLERFVFHLILS